MSGTIGRRIVLARYHDGTAKANWGGRGTSLALAGLIAGIPGVETVIPLNGTYITEEFGDFTQIDKLAARLRHARRHGIWQRSAQFEARPFAYVDQYTDRLLTTPRNPRAQRLIKTIELGDELWMNGEGNFIMGYSRELWRTLIIMTIAHRLGKRVVLVNSILSEPTSGIPVPTILSGVRTVLERCAAVLYRDPTSLERSREWFPGVEAEWLPDALFQWSRDQGVSGAYTATVEGLPLEIQAMLDSSEQIATVSGSSVLRTYTPARERHLGQLVQGMRQAGLTPVFVATSDEDSWWREPAGRLKMPFVSARVPLRSGLALLARSEVFVSGRYHPSILAADVGTPFVTFGSNSHKTTSLYRVLGDDCSTGFGFPTLDTDPVMSGLLAATTAAAGRSSSRPAIRAAAQGAADRTARRMIATGTSSQR